MEVTNTEYASKGIAGAGLGLGIAGTALGLLGGNNPLGGLLGGNNTATATMLSSEKELSEAKAQIAKLESERYTDQHVQAALQREQVIHDKIARVVERNENRISALEVAAPLREQIVLGQVQNVANSLACAQTQNATSFAAINATLSSITKCVVPNTSVCPGWGGVTITPATVATTA